MQGEQVLEVLHTVERRGPAHVAEATLLPHEVNRGAGTVLPPHDGVRVELFEVQAARVAGRTAGCALAIECERLVATIVRHALWIGELAQIRERSLRDVRLRIELQREVRR